MKSTEAFPPEVLKNIQETRESNGGIGARDSIEKEKNSGRTEAVKGLSL